ncbi:MAG: nicotinate-nucleotide--dimethylbenzimidazole phosphoribosyltransferase [Bdellovibrionia bacterium]
MEAFIESTIGRIQPHSTEWKKKAVDRVSQLTMPYWALGRLLDLGVDLVAMTRSLSPRFEKKAVFILASDHGVTQEGVSLYPKEVTLQMVKNFMSQTAAIHALCRPVGAQVVIADFGVDGDLSEFSSTGRLWDYKIGHGTENFAEGPAMTRNQALQSVRFGMDLVFQHQHEVDVFAAGEMGIGNTTASAAVASVLLDVPVERIVGRGTGLNDAQLMHKVEVVKRALKRNQPQRADPWDVLARVGGFEIGGLAGMILAAASLQKPWVMDGYIASTAALIAQALCPWSMDYVIASHQSQEQGHRLILDYLGKKPLLDLALRLGEGSGAALALNFVEAAVRVITETATFESAQVSTAHSSSLSTSAKPAVVGMERSSE